MKTWRWAVLAVAAVLFMASITAGPLLAGAEAKNGTTAALRAAKSSQQAAQTASGVLRIVQFIQSVQNGPQAKAGRQATAWYVKEFINICAATPRCEQVPLPPSLQADR